MVDFQIVDLDQVTLVEVSGRVDSATAEQLGAVLSEQFNRGRRYLVIDLARVDYMSSAGLRELVLAFKQAQKLSGDVRLAQPSHRVQEILEMAGLDTIFQIFPARADALASF